MTYWDRLWLSIEKFNFVETTCFRTIRTNNTSQVSPAVRRGEAQTGGLLFCRIENATNWRIINPNTPAMPLNDAHFGGFFASGVRK